MVAAHKTPTSLSVVPPSSKKSSSNSEEPIQLSFSFSLPAAEPDEISEADFRREIDKAMKTANHVGLTGEWLNGKTLTRSREYYAKTDNPNGFTGFLKETQTTKAQAYRSMETASKAEEIFGDETQKAVSKLTKQSLNALAQVEPEVQELVKEEIASGKFMRKGDVRQLADEWDAKTSSVLPDNIKQGIASGAIPARIAAPLVREFKHLSEPHVNSIVEDLAESDNPIEALKLSAKDAKNIAKYLNASGQVEALKGVDMELALDEAIKIGAIDVAANLIKGASSLENTVTKLVSLWKKLGDLSDRLYVDTGASAPNLRAALSALDSLTRELIRVKIGNDKEIRLQVFSEDSYEKLRKQIKEELIAQIGAKDYSWLPTFISEEEGKLQIKAKDTDSLLDRLCGVVGEYEARQSDYRDKIEQHYKAQYSTEIEALRAEMEALKSEKEAIAAERDAVKAQLEEAVFGASAEPQQHPSESYPEKSLKVDAKTIPHLQEQLTALSDTNLLLQKENKELHAAIAADGNGLVRGFAYNVLEVVARTLKGDVDEKTAKNAANVVAIATSTKIPAKVHDFKTWAQTVLSNFNPELIAQIEAIAA